MERNTWMDGIKFILIVLVIFGHCKHFTSYDGTLLSTKLFSRAIHSIYLFHMPLFICISGFFSRKTDNTKFRHSITKLLRVFVVFHLLWIGIDLLCGSTFSFYRLIIPSFTLWYLLSLVYWRCILQLIPKRFDKWNIILPITILVSLLGGLIPLTNELSIPRTLTFMPVFFLGYYAKRNEWLKYIRKAHLLWFLIPAIALLIFENQIFMDVYGRRPYVEFADVVKRGVYLSSSIVISIAFIKILPQKISVFSNEGKDVLFYYVYHSFVLFVIASVLDKIGIVVSGIGLLLIVLTTTIILFVCNRIKWLHIPLH